jgi:hypothetical protein
MPRHIVCSDLASSRSSFSSGCKAHLVWKQNMSFGKYLLLTPRLDEIVQQPSWDLAARRKVLLGIVSPQRDQIPWTKEHQDKKSSALVQGVASHRKLLFIFSREILEEGRLPGVYLLQSALRLVSRLNRVPELSALLIPATCIEPSSWYGNSPVVRSGKVLRLALASRRVRW